MSWRRVQSLKSSWSFCSRVALGKQSRVVTARAPEGIRTLFASASEQNADKTTHTGQKWEKDDYRNIRFTDREKQVNEQFAISLLAEEAVVVVKGTHVWCDGGGGALGHPRVYINLDKPEINDCGYCGKRFLAQKNKELFPKENFVDAQEH